jgi:hypothetical protein
LAWSYDRWHNVQLPVYTDITTDNYSFSVSADQRYLSFSSILGASISFADMRLCFKYYTLMECSLKYDPIILSSQEPVSTALPPFYANVEYNISSPVNPTNSDVISMFDSLIHPMSKFTSTIKNYSHKADPYSTFNTALNNKYSTQVNPNSGSFIIGAGPSVTFPATNIQVGVLNMNFWVHWEGSKA